MPNYHFRPEANWVNDPHGFVKVGDTYHLFYQYNPFAPEPGIKHWGHAVTQDLVRWDVLPLALSPTHGGPDQSGCWSGSITTLVEPAHLFYTGVRHDSQLGRSEVVCLALGDPDLRAWRKYPDVLIPGPPDALDTVGFRDPFVWRDDESWCLLVGSGIRGHGGAVLLYRSSDLLHWRYAGVFFSLPARRGDDDTGPMWECPQLVPLGDRHVLMISVDNPVRPTLYVVGKIDDGRFIAERIGRVDVGPDFFAPTVLVEDDGRPLIIAWSPEARSNDSQVAAGWAGVMTLPRALSLTPEGRLCSAPAIELVRLRGDHWHANAVSLPPDGEVALPVAGSRLEISALVWKGGATTIGLRIRTSPDGRETTVLSVDVSTGRICFDRTASSSAPEALPGAHEGGDGWVPGDRVRLHVFIDESIVELFVDESLAMTGRVYPTRTDSLAIAAFAVGPNAEIETIDIWHLDRHGSRDHPSPNSS